MGSHGMTSRVYYRPISAGQVELFSLTLETHHPLVPAGFLIRLSYYIHVMGMMLVIVMVMVMQPAFTGPHSAVMFPLATNLLSPVTLFRISLVPPLLSPLYNPAELYHRNFCASIKCPLNNSRLHGSLLWKFQFVTCRYGSKIEEPSIGNRKNSYKKHWHLFLLVKALWWEIFIQVPAEGISPMLIRTIASME